MGIEFDEPTHTYKIDGRRAPGIHEILGLAGVLKGMPDDPSYRERGKRVHLGIQYMLEDDLDVDEFTDEELGYVEAARSAIRELGLDIRHTELLVCNPKLWYATRVDVVAKWRERWVIVDWKTGGSWPWYPLQTAATALCFEFPYRRLAIYLNPDGTWRPEEHIYQDDYDSWRHMCGTVDWLIRKGGQSLKPGPTEPEPVEFPEPPSKMFEPPEPKRRPGLF